MIDKSVLHLDLDAFFVSVERLKNSALNNRPVIIGGGGQRGVVASCSYEARAFGVHSAMPVSMARRLCPDALLIKGDMDRYIEQSKIITEMITEEAPLFEKASIDEFYLDLSGMDKYIGCWQWSKELRNKIIKETGLPLSAGLSVNKLVSKVSAGEAKPNGASYIPSGDEKNFLAPLLVSKLPSVGKVTSRKLSFMGVRHIRTLSQIPPELLQREFGKKGLSLWKKANGIDNSPIVPYHDRKSISSETTFQTDTIDVRKLKGHLTDMASKLAYKLRESQKLTATVTVKIRYSDFNTYSRQKQIPYTASENKLIAHAHELLDALYQRRVLIRLIGLKFSKLTHGSPQMDLFEDSEKEINLLQRLDHIRKRFGLNAIKRGSAL